MFLFNQRQPLRAKRAEVELWLLGGQCFPVRSRESSSECVLTMAHLQFCGFCGIPPWLRPYNTDVGSLELWSKLRIYSLVARQEGSKRIPIQSPEKEFVDHKSWEPLSTSGLHHLPTPSNVHLSATFYDPNYGPQYGPLAWTLMYHIPNRGP